MSNGKGSKRRPLSVSQDEFEANWDNIFKKKKYVVPVKETADGDQFIELPDELTNKLGWKEGDEVKMEKHEDGYKVTKERSYNKRSAS